jgi:hypothetical protein
LGCTITLRKWRSKVRTSCTNESTSKPGTTQMNKDQFYGQLDRAYAACPSHDVKLVMGDANAKVGRETVNQTTIGKHSLHKSTNENYLRLASFAASRQMAIKSTYFMLKRIHFQTWHYSDGHTFNQINHCLIDGRNNPESSDKHHRLHEKTSKLRVV